MRFRFCGDLDCPDWVLAEINTLSRMTSIKMKLLCQVVMTSVLGENLDFEKAKRLTSDAKFEEGDVKGGVAALGFVLKSAARHGVDAAWLDSELQQLGLPRELALAVSRCHADQGALLIKRLAKDSLRLSRLENAQWCAADEGKVRLHLTYTDLVEEKPCELKMSLTKTQALTLLADLKRIRSRMQELSGPE